MVERDLILALKEGNEGAFKELYDIYWKNVFHFATLYIRNSEEVREIVQEVFIKLWEARESLKAEESLKGFLFIVTRNHIFNRARSKSFNYDFYEVTLNNALEQSYNIEQEMDAKDLAIYIDELVNQMPPQRKMVFTLSRKEYKSYKEIALLLDISEKTVERHINESLKFIKANLKLFLLFLFIN